jgi:hypothetical protein
MRARIRQGRGMKRPVNRLLSLVFLSLVSLPAPAQERVATLSGTVVDEETGQPLPGVTFLVLNSSRGTVSGSDGAFRLSLPSGEYTIVVTSVGYLPDTISVPLRRDYERIVRLRPSPVQLQEVLVLAEDPGVDIIRKAIANKRKWMDLLKTYEFDAYTKRVLRRDTSIASITESYTKGYWRPEDGLREIIQQRRQTENIAAGQNLAAVGQILNFNDDEVRLAGYRFVGPTAPEALDNYDYKLERTYESKGVRVYELQMKPRSAIKPLFEGTISIADSTYAVMRVNVRPNESFRFPFVSNLSVRYQQRFNLYNSLFWMPADISIIGGADLSVPGFSFPRFTFEQRSVLYEYRINTSQPDSLFELRRITVDSAATKFDSTFWRANQVLPLTAVEVTAYRTLDSTQTLEKQFRPGGALSVLDRLSDLPLEYVDLRFNRVEGFFFGGRLGRQRILTDQTWIEGGIGYGFSDRRWKWTAGITQEILGKPNLRVGVEGFRAVDYRPDQNFYSTFLISLGSLFRRDDYRDYYSARGWRSFVLVRPRRWLSGELEYRSEKQKSVANATDFSFFSRESRYRLNPPVEEGRLRSVRLSVQLENFLTRGVISGTLVRPLQSVILTIEHSVPGLRSDFDFTRYDFVLSLRQSTFLSGLLFPPRLSVRLAGGTIRGKAPPQRLYDLESRYSGIAPYGVLRGLRVKEFSGDRYLSLVGEHNFRSLPFHWIGLGFLEKAGIELIVSGGIAQTWLNRATRSQLPFPVQTTCGWYKEVGFGVSRIFGFLEADCTWRFGKQTGDRFFFSLSLADIF